MGLSKGMEHEQIVVARDKEVCPGCRGEFEEFIVLRIAAVVDGLGRGEPFGVACYSSKYFESHFGGHIAVKLTPHENLCKLAHRLLRERVEVAFQDAMNALS